MTGLELLKKEMLLRGCNKSQTESKILPVVLEILANDAEHRFTDLSKTLTDLMLAKAELASLRIEIVDAQEQLKLLREQNEAEKRVIDEYTAKQQEYVTQFQQSLTECETKEGKDAMRAAQTFVNSVTIKTVYDNTAYIVGLASILSGKEMGAIEELKKINKKMFQDIEAEDFDCVEQATPKAGRRAYSRRRDR